MMLEHEDLNDVTPPAQQVRERLLDGGGGPVVLLLFYGCLVPLKLCFRSA